MLKLAARVTRRAMPNGVGTPGSVAIAGEPGRYVAPWRVAALLVGAALACLAALALATLPAGTAPRSRALPARHGLQSHAATRLPINLAAAATASVGASEHRYWPLRRGASLLTQGGGIQGTFTAAGAALRVDHGTLGLSLAAVGRGGGTEKVAAVAPKGAANQVLYGHGSINELYRNGPFGLEQAFSLRARPQAGTGPLVLALGLAGSLRPEQAGSQILFKTHSGATALRYGQLSALDATGRRLPAHMRLANGTLQLQIDDSGARYPIRIDPFIQQGAKLTGSGETGKGFFGVSVALSGNGTTALIGAEHDNEMIGAAWVFTRSGSTWTQQGSKLTGSGESGAGRFGSAVALSNDGNTALIGGEADNTFVGAAWVFTRSGSTWSQQGSKLTGSGETGKAEFGQSVALSSEGSTALIGGEADNTFAGAAWVFTRSGNKWTQQGSKLTGSGESGEGSLGVSVALSGDGNTALIGGWGDNAFVGAAWVFTRSGSTWTQQGSKLTGSGESGAGFFGVSVALSGEAGNTAVIGGAGDSSNMGAAWVFTRSGSTWTQQGSKLTGGGEVSQGEFGISAALSSNGNTALIGGWTDTGSAGAAWVFTRSGSTWTQQGEKLTGGGEVGAGRFGASVALSADTSTALIGGEADNGEIGAAWAFTNTPTVVTGLASAVTHTSATLNATVNPNGQTVTDCHFEYGTTTAYGTSVPCSSLPGSGESPVAVSASVTGLSENTTYHFRISASNANGTSQGSDQTFGPPTVVTGAASSVTNSSATLSATVNPNNVEVSECKLEYGTTTAYGSSAPCTPSPGSGNSPVAVSASVTGLTANTTYHFRISATNGSGTSKGSDQTFKTLPNSPTVVTKPASAVTQTSATLNATVNPNGSTVSDCHFEYGTTTSYGTSVPCSSLPGSGESPVAVSASVTGLSANTTYHFRISATNASGTSKGSDQAFGAPTPVTGEASAISQTSVTLNATVNPNGQTVSDCHFEYGTTTAYGTSVACSSLPGSGESPVAVSAAISGLTAKTTYHFRISATNPSGTSKGSDQVVKTLPNAPTTVTGEASAITQTSATLNATVNPNGGELVECEFVYGTTLNYTSRSGPCVPWPGSSESAVAVSVPITGLAPNTNYHYRINAANAGGARAGADHIFKTLPNPPTVGACEVSSITQTSAALCATVNPNGGEVSECKLEWGATTGYGSSVPCTPPPGSGTSPVTVSGAISGLSPSTTYHFRVSATNAGGTSVGSDQSFKTLKPPAFATSFGPPNNLEGGFREPNAVALDPSGNIWVADSGHNRVLEFNKERKYVRQVGSEGSGEGQFRGIGGIATDSSGDVYVSGSDRVQEFSSTGAFLRQFGSAGSGNGQLQYPTGLAVDSSGNVWVLDTFNFRVQEFSASGAFISKFGSQGTGNGQFGWDYTGGLAFSGGNLYVANASRVQEFSTAGTFLAQFGSSGTGNGQFHGLGGIATDPSTGNLYVSDVGNNRVQKFTAAGVFIRAFGSGGSGNGQFSGPRGVAVGSSGTIFVADTGNNRVQEWAAGEPPTFATSFTPSAIEGGFGEPNAVAIDPSGNIWVADSGHNRLLEFNFKREFLRQVGSEGTGEGQFRGILAIAANSAGDVYVSGSDRVQEFSPTGAFLRQFGSGGSGDGQFLYPTAITVDSSGNVWVLDTFNYRVQEFSETGAFISKFGSQGTGNGQFGWDYTGGLAFSGGNLYVANASRVQEFSTAGTYLAQFGSSGTGNGQFHGLGGIATDPTNGNLYVSDVGNNRVQELSAAGGFIAAFGSGGSGTGQFSGPTGLGINSSGGVYVADRGNNRVQEWVPSP